MCILGLYVVMINGYPSSFFWVGRGLRQGCSLSPLLFILITDDLSLNIKEGKSLDLFKDLRLSNRVITIHLFFC